MKRTMSWLFALVFSVMMILVALPSQAMAGEVQLAQVQPTKAEVLSQLGQGTQVAQVQPSKAQVLGEAGVSTGEIGTEADVGTLPLCTYCNTCGGIWPNFGGINRSPSASTSKAYMRDTNCSGALMWRNDEFPYLCCRRFI